MKTSHLRLKLVELNFFASFNADDQRKTYVSDVSKKKKKKKKEIRLEIWNLPGFDEAMSRALLWLSVWELLKMSSVI